MKNRYLPSHSEKKYETLDYSRSTSLNRFWVVFDFFTRGTYVPVRCRRGGGLEGKFEISWRQGPLKRARGPILSRLCHKPSRALRKEFEARLGAHGPSPASETKFLASRDCHARPSDFEHLGWDHVHLHRAQFEYPRTLIYILVLYSIILMILGGQDLYVGGSSKSLPLWKVRVVRIFHFLQKQ